MKRLTLTLALGFTFATAAQAQTFNPLQTDAGRTVTATSTASASFPVESTVNADATGYQWGTGDPAGGGWNSGHSERYGVSELRFDFSHLYSIVELEIVGVRTDYHAYREPAEGEASLYANVDYDILYTRNGVDWGLVREVRGNDKVINRFTFGQPVDTFPLFARAVKLKFYNAANSGGFARVVEVRMKARQ